MGFIDKIKPRIKRFPDGLSLKDKNVLLATWFGAGMLRPAPGTIGTLAALPFGFVVATFCGIWGLVAIILIFSAIGAVAADYIEKKSGEHDSQSIVIDEAVGLWIAGIPAVYDPALWIPAFLLFRLFDITKPWPASYFDGKKSGGWGVMLDDIVAGIYAFLGVATLAALTMQ